jgi:hypothetical protein
MVNISLINILDPKIIHDECECEQTRFMIPEAGGIDALVIPKRGQFPVNAFVGKDTPLWKAPHQASHFKVDPSVLGMLCKSYCSTFQLGKRLSGIFIYSKYSRAAVR